MLRYSFIYMATKKCMLYEIQKKELSLWFDGLTQGKEGFHWDSKKKQNLYMLKDKGETYFRKVYFKKVKDKKAYDLVKPIWQEWWINSERG